LQYAAGRGFRTQVVQQARVRMGEGYAGRAALERRLISIQDLAGRKETFRHIPLFAEEEFVSYFAAPLISKGQVKGVLEIFHRNRIEPDPEWLEFLDTLAVQAAIAIDNSALFEDLQRSNLELAMAYDATIEGWSRALDMRDRETEGHTLRVTEMAMRLARIMDIPDEELVHVRRGALLHDIGKMGIPDSILLKPGPLSDDEWRIMRRHPEFAHELLALIAYLRPALDIPYCHHEKWDGSGYPRGLRGDAIPLCARIFAVVDVWDALRSERPYRTAWPEEKVTAFVRQESGRHFDPHVVDYFLQMVAQDGFLQGQRMEAN
jgi:putative nucleotidyltransferase with HDIG domain